MTRQKEEARREAGLKGLYRSELEHDACGVGAVVNIKGRASHKVIEDALLILHNLDHRGAVAPIRSAATARAFSFRFRTPSTARRCVRRALSFPQSATTASA